MKTVTVVLSGEILDTPERVEAEILRAEDELLVLRAYLAMLKRDARAELLMVEREMRRLGTMPTSLGNLDCSHDPDGGCPVCDPDNTKDWDV